jgi:citrate synthase
VDFYSGLIYRAMGFPTDMFPVLYAIPRLAGWLAHWTEFQQDKEQQLVRPRQSYTGSGRRAFVEMSEREEHPRDIEATASQSGIRRASAKRYA